MSRQNRNRQLIKTKLIESCFSPEHYQQVDRSVKKSQSVYTLNKYDARPNANPFNTISPYFLNRPSKEIQQSGKSNIKTQKHNLEMSDQRSESNSSRFSYTPSVKIAYQTRQEPVRHERLNLINHIPSTDAKLPARYKQLMNSPNNLPIRYERIPIQPNLDSCVKTQFEPAKTTKKISMKQVSKLKEVESLKARGSAANIKWFKI